MLDMNIIAYKHFVLQILKTMSLNSTSYVGNVLMFFESQKASLQS